ncbi:hypothetical protein ACOME3_004650 [Neoechinorhynchus agilis]
MKCHLCSVTFVGGTQKRLHLQHLHAQHQVKVTVWMRPLCNEYEHKESRSVGIHLRRCKAKFPDEFRAAISRPTNNPVNTMVSVDANISYNGSDEIPAKCPVCDFSLLGIGRYNSIVSHVESVPKHR